MPDDQKMYFTMMEATEQSIQILIEAQREAEEIYVSTAQPGIHSFPPQGQQNRGRK